MSILFSDGYCLRQICEYLRHSLTDISLEICPSSVNIMESNPTRSLLHSFVLTEITNTHSLTANVAVNLVEMCRMLRSVGKGDRLCMTIADKVDLRVLSYCENISYVTIKDIPIQGYELPYNDYKSPNCVINPLNWSKVCLSFLSTKPIQVEFTCYQHGMKIQALNGSYVVAKECIFGDINDEEICSHRIYPETLKALARINQMAVRGVLLKLYFDEVIHFKLRGVLGEYLLLLRDEVL